MSWIEDTAKAKTWGTGNFFTAGRGTLILQDVKVFRGFKDPETFAADFCVKESIGPEANAVGSTVSYICQLNKQESGKSNMKALILEILKTAGPESGTLSDEQLAGEIRELLRIAEKGPMANYTDPSLGACPARGVEIAYETRNKTSRKGVDMVLPTFRAKVTTADMLKANRKLLGD